MKQFLTGIGVTVAILLVVAGAYFLGLRLPGRQEAQTDEAGSGIPESLIDFTPEPPQEKGVSAGGAVNFPNYRVIVPPQWLASGKHDNINDTDELTIFQGEYEIRVYQAAAGGSLCLYPGDAPFEGPSATYEEFSEFNTSAGLVFRRGGDTGDSAFTICELKADGSYLAPTMFGHVSYSLPDGYDPDVLAEMDAVMATISEE